CRRISRRSSSMRVAADMQSSVFVSRSRRAVAAIIPARDAANAKRKRASAVTLLPIAAPTVEAHAQKPKDDHRRDFEEEPLPAVRAQRIAKRRRRRILAHLAGLLFQGGNDSIGQGGGDKNTTRDQEQKVKRIARFFRRHEDS